MNIYFDIETIPLQDPALIAEFIAEHKAKLPDLLAAVKAPGNYRDEAKIADFIANERIKIAAGHGAEFDDWYAKTSFDGGLGQVCCIGFAIDDEPAQTYTVNANNVSDERGALEAFFCHLTDAHKVTDRPVFIGHNSNGFDIPFIWKRCIVLGVKPPIWFPRDPKPWGDSTFDTMIAWTGPGARAGGSMERICKILGIPGKQGMDGSQVWPFFQAGRIAEIAAYCAADVERTRIMYQRMTFASA